MEKPQKKEKISPEEKLYREAVQLTQSVSCVLRFEQKVAAFESAAHKFKKLGDYKDSAQRKKECKDLAKKAQKKGSKAVFAKALKKEEQAKTKSDYVDVITEFKRVKGLDPYQEQAKQHIAVCKKKIARITRITAWKRRLIALAVIAVCVVLALAVVAWVRQ